MSSKFEECKTISVKIDADTGPLSAKLDALARKGKTIEGQVKAAICACDKLESRLDTVTLYAAKIDALIFRTRKEAERLDKLSPAWKSLEYGYGIKPGMFVVIESADTRHYGSIGIVRAVNESAGKVQTNIYLPEESVTVPLVFLRPVSKQEC